MQGLVQVKSQRLKNSCDYNLLKYKQIKLKSGG